MKKQNVILRMKNVEQARKIDNVLIDNINKEYSDFQDEFPLYLINNGQANSLKYTLSSIDPFLMLLVMLFVGSFSKLSWISWYKNMKPFRSNLKLVINKYVCGMNSQFPIDKCSDNDFMLSNMTG